LVVQELLRELVSAESEGKRCGSKFRVEERRQRVWSTVERISFHEAILRSAKEKREEEKEETSTGDSSLGNPQELFVTLLGIWAIKSHPPRSKKE